MAHFVFYFTQVEKTSSGELNCAEMNDSRYGQKQISRSQFDSMQRSQLSKSRISAASFNISSSFLDQSQQSLVQNRIVREIDCSSKRKLDGQGMNPSQNSNLICWIGENLIIVMRNQIMRYNYQTKDIKNVHQHPTQFCYVTNVLPIFRKECLIFTDNNSTLKIVDLKINETIRTWDSNSDSQITSLAIGSSLVAIGFQNGNLALMDITKTNEYICILENAHSQQINSIAFNKSNTLIASSGDDKTTNIYSIKTYWQNQKKTHLTPSKMKPIIQIDVHRCEVTALAWSPTAENVLVIAEKKLFSLYDVETKDFTASVKIRAEISAIVWSSKYNEIVTAHSEGKEEGRIQIWDPTDLMLKKTFQAHKFAIQNMQMNPKTEQVVSLCKNTELCFWEFFPPKENKHSIGFDF